MASLTPAHARQRLQTLKDIYIKNKVCITFISKDEVNVHPSKLKIQTLPLEAVYCSDELYTRVMHQLKGRAAKSTNILLLEPLIHKPLFMEFFALCDLMTQQYSLDQYYDIPTIDTADTHIFDNVHTCADLQEWMNRMDAFKTRLSLYAAPNYVYRNHIEFPTQG